MIANKEAQLQQTQQLLASKDAESQQARLLACKPRHGLPQILTMVLCDSVMPSAMQSPAAAAAAHGQQSLSQVTACSHEA